MTATQSLKLFEISKRYFQNENDARSFVEEIENVVDNKFKSEKEQFASMSSVEKLDFKIEMLRQEMKTGFAEARAENRAESNKIVIWLVSTMFAMLALLYTLIKLFEK